MFAVAVGEAFAQLAHVGSPVAVCSGLVSTCLGRGFDRVEARRGNAPLARLERLGEFLPIRFQKLEGKPLRDRVDGPGFREVLKCAEHHRIPFTPKINAQVGVTSDRQFVEGAGDWLSNYVMMFDWIKRDRYSTL